MNKPVSSRTRGVCLLATALTALAVSCGLPGIHPADDLLAADAQGALPALDKGGFTVDFRGAGRTPVSGEDLLTNGSMERTDSAGRPAGWTAASYVWLPVADAAQQERMQTRIAPLMRWGSAEGRSQAGRRAMHLASPRAAYDQHDPAGHEFCAYYRQYRVLPPLPRSMKYILSFYHRGHSDPDVPNSRPYARVTFYDDENPARGSQTRTYAQNIFMATNSWRRGQLQFGVPKNTRCLEVWLALAGCGEVRFDDVTLHRALIQERGPTVRLMPGHYLDNLYCLSAGDAGVMIFGFRNESAAKIESPCLVLRLPEGIDVLDLDASASILSRKPIRVQGAAVQEHRIDIRAWKRRIRDGTFPYPYNMWQGLALLLRSSLPPGQARYTAWYWLEDGQYRTKPRSFEFRIVVPIPSVHGPRRFRSGAHLFLVHRFLKETGSRAFAKLYKQVGFNAVHVPATGLAEELGRLGIERYNQPLANGYTMGDRRPGKKPEEAVFRLADGQPVWEAICPVEVYRRGAYFRERIENGILRRILVTDRQAEQIMANWEPYMYNGKGCFCNRCKEEFRTFSKLSAQEIERVWPSAVLREYRDTWVKFRSWQHAKLMVTLEETVNALGKEAGLDSHFIPEIHHGLLTSSWDKRAGNREYAAVDYLGKLPVLNAWAPYTWHVFGRGPYDYVRGLHLSVHATARDVRAFVDSRLPAGKRPRLIAFPYGTYEGATQPEALAFEFLTYFLNGYSGAFAYLFPGGYDARYWRALAQANRQIAQFESLVMRGREVRKHGLRCETPLPKPDPRFLAKCGGAAGIAKRWKDLPLLLSWEFERDDTRLIAVGNFWERGECFFRLTLRELDPDREYVLHEPALRRCYADRAGRIALSARELASGLLLHVGAMRHSFLVLEPFREAADYGKIVRPQDMETVMEARRVEGN